MNEALYASCSTSRAGALLLTAVLVLWRRELSVIIRVFALQGIALAGAGRRARHATRVSVELGAVAVGVLVLRAGVLPALLRRAIGCGRVRAPRETRPLVNVAASLLAAAALTLLAYAGVATAGGAGALAGRRRPSRSASPWC